MRPNSLEEAKLAAGQVLVRELVQTAAVPNRCDAIRVVKKKKNNQNDQHRILNDDCAQFVGRLFACSITLPVNENRERMVQHQMMKMLHQRLVVHDENTSPLVHRVAQQQVNLATQAAQQLQARGAVWTGAAEADEHLRLPSPRSVQCTGHLCHQSSLAGPRQAGDTQANATE